jgi:hypothetical protein
MIFMLGILLQQAKRLTPIRAADSIRSTNLQQQKNQTDPNNQIPKERIDPTSLKLLEFWPKPNLNTPTISQNFLNPQKTPIDKVQFNRRIEMALRKRRSDSQFSERMRKACRLLVTNRPQSITSFA